MVSSDVLADLLVSAIASSDRRSCSLIDLLYHAMGISSVSPVIASSSGGIRQLDEVGSLGAQSGIPSSSVARFPPSSSFSPRFALSAPSSSLPSYSRLSFPASPPPPFFCSFDFSSGFFLCGFSSNFRLSPSPVRHFCSSFFFALFACSPSSLSRSFSLTSPVHPVCSFAPSVPAFVPLVSSLASPVVTVTTSFLSSPLASSSSSSLVFASASPVVSSGQVGSFSRSRAVPSSSLAFSSQPTSLPPLDPAASSVSSQFAAPSSSLPAPSVAPKVPQSSPSAGPHVFYWFPAGYFGYL